MTEAQVDWEQALQEVEEAIAAMKKALDGPTLEAALVPLLDKRARYEALLEGSGGVAQGEGATAAGERGIAVGGDVGGDIITDERRVETGGGAYIGGDVRAGGDVIGRDKIEAHYPDPAQSAAERARERYLKRVHQRCNVLPVAAMGGEEGVGDEVSLDQVYVALDTKTRAPLTEEEKAARKEDLSFLMRGEDKESRSLTALEAATQERRLALLGDPGSGKSTFVRQLAAHTAQVRLIDETPFPDWERGLTPVLVTLHELAPDLAALDLDALSEAAQERRLVETVREFLAAQLRACKAQNWDERLEDALLAGDVLLIFDGLDEVAEMCRGRVRRAVGALLQAYGDLRRVIVTCRVRSYTGEAEFPGFTSHTLAPFDEEKIKAFVSGWYQAQYNLGRLKQSVAEDRANDLQQAALDDDLRELASNPMLLTTMALIHQREVGLPRERVRLYSLAVQVLLTRWQKRKGFSVSQELATVLSNDLKLRAILERLAYEAHQGQADRSRAADLERKDILAILEDMPYLGGVGLAAEFLDYVDQRSGLLVGQGGIDEGCKPKTYTFPHRTFQEYLAGCYMAGEWDALDVYWRHAGEGDAWYLAAVLGAEELHYNGRGDKILLNLAYDLAPVDEPETEQAWRATLWSGQMAALFPPEEIRRVMQGPKPGAAYLERLTRRLVQILQEERLRAVERAEAGKALAKLGDPRPGVGLRDDGLPDIVWCEIPAGPFLMGNDNERDESIADCYRISRYPVTNAQFEAFVQAGGYQEERYWQEAIQAEYWRDGAIKSRIDDRPYTAPKDYGEPFNLPNHPVVGVTWYEAVAFCRWLTEMLRGEGEVGGDTEIALPSESQWEKAARGTDGRVYPWGDKPDPERANYGDTGIGTTSAVGCFPGGRSPYGIEDASGNVWEWVGDGPVLRGGLFGYPDVSVRCASRHLRSYPDSRLRSIGFRVVASPFTSEI
ncbi:MAG TPA: hypothetical protein ENN19_04605 [Chloroflexi bacterium]|nr:hypothetical protein [Chloroflexota bacterium]